MLAGGNWGEQLKEMAKNTRIKEWRLKKRQMLAGHAASWGGVNLLFHYEKQQGNCSITHRDVSY